MLWWCLQRTSWICSNTSLGSSCRSSLANWHHWKEERSSQKRRSWLMSMPWLRQVGLTWFSLQPFKLSTALWRAKEDHHTRQFLEGCPVFQVIYLEMKEHCWLVPIMCSWKNFVHKPFEWLLKQELAVWSDVLSWGRQPTAVKKLLTFFLEVWLPTGDGLRRQRGRSVAATSLVVYSPMIQMAKVLGYIMAIAWCRWPMSSCVQLSALKTGHRLHRMCRFWRMVLLDFSKIYGKMNVDQLHHQMSLWMPKSPSKMPTSFNNYLTLQCLWWNQV